jgi:hypothetical protein
MIRHGNSWKDQIHIFGGLAATATLYICKQKSKTIEILIVKFPCLDE